MLRRFETLCSIFIGGFLLLTPPLKTKQSVPKRRPIKSKRLGIAQEKEYIIQNKAKV
jgi:hypothetical protein